MSKQENVPLIQIDQATLFASQLLQKLQDGNSFYGLTAPERHLILELTGGEFSFRDEIKSTQGSELINVKVDAITALQNYIDTAPERYRQAVLDTKKVTSIKQLGGIVRASRNAIVGIAGATAVGAVGIGATKLGVEGYNYVQQSADNGRIERQISNDSKLAEQKARNEKDGMIRMIDYKTIQNPNTTSEERASLKKKLESE